MKRKTNKRSILKRVRQRKKERQRFFNNLCRDIVQEFGFLSVAVCAAGTGIIAWCAQDYIGDFASASEVLTNRSAHPLGVLELLPRLIAPASVALACTYVVSRLYEPRR